MRIWKMTGWCYSEPHCEKMCLGVFDQWRYRWTIDSVHESFMWSSKALIRMHRWAFVGCMLWNRFSRDASWIDEGFSTWVCLVLREKYLVSYLVKGRGNTCVCMLLYLTSQQYLLEFLKMKLKFSDCPTTVSSLSSLICSPADFAQEKMYLHPTKIQMVLKMYNLLGILALYSRIILYSSKKTFAGELIVVHKSEKE